MLEVWLPLLAIAIIATWWYRVLRLRERAVARARQLCERLGLQLLDDSVALHRLRVHWRHGALHATREYRFETSRGGDDRQSASLTMFGDRIVSARLPPGEPFADAAPARASLPIAPPLPSRRDEAAGNVIPFDRERRTLH